MKVMSIEQTMIDSFGYDDLPTEHLQSYGIEKNCTYRAYSIARNVPKKKYISKQVTDSLYIEHHENQGP